MNKIKPIFTYYISQKQIDGFDKHFQFGSFIINTDDRTPVDIVYSDNLSIAIIGIAIDTENGSSVNIASHMIEACRSIDEVIAFEYKLGGKYIILTKDDQSMYIFGDATCSIPICYTFSNGNFGCASDSFIVAKINSFSEDKELMRIRKSGDLSQAMPYNITVYKEIKQLLPNHVLNMVSGEERRCCYFENEVREISPAEAATEILPLLFSMVKGYKEHFEVIVPITSGKDSRVVLAVTEKVVENVKTYTLKHLKHTDRNDDLVIAKQLTNHLGIEHYQYDDINTPLELINYMNDVLGEGTYSKKSLQIAATVKEYFESYAIMNGDIVGQIGKCSLHRDIPEALASAGYFRCKMHNYSKEAKALTRIWLKDIKESDEHMSVFDLFSLENRMGRWSSMNTSIYNYAGQVIINMFNSRSIIGFMCRVNRSRRMNSEIHIELLKLLNQRYLEIPFGGASSGITRWSKKNGINFYLASYYKFYADKMKYLIRH